MMDFKAIAEADSGYNHVWSDMEELNYWATKLRFQEPLIKFGALNL